VRARSQLAGASRAWASSWLRWGRLFAGPELLICSLYMIAEALVAIDSRMNVVYMLLVMMWCK
jgi:hypothetical protein